MGLNIGFNAITTGGLFLAAILLVIMAILLLTADAKIRNIPEFDQSSDLQDGHNRLKTAYIVTFVAAGVALLLAIAYAGHEIWWGPSELFHMLFFLILVALWVIAVIYAYTVLEGLYNPELEDRNGADAFIWGALWISILAFLVILATGSGRAGYNVVRGRVTERFTDLEHKVHLTHSRLTGEPVNYDLIAANPPGSEDCPEMVGPPPGVMVGPPPPGVMVGPPPPFARGPNCPPPRCPPSRPVVVHTSPVPVPTHTVAQVGPPLRTTQTTVTQSQPLVSTTQRTVTRQEGGFF